MGKPGPKPRRREVLWSPDIAYAVGLMASDGCLSSDGRHFTFVSKDKEQIDNLRNCLNITAHVSRKPSGRPGDRNLYHRLQWGDVVLYDFLLNLGLTANKSLTLGALKIPDNYFFDFLRGSFDGDGCFYSYFDPRLKSSFMFYLVFTSASFKHVSWIQKTLQRLSNVGGHMTTTKSKENRHDFYQLRYAKKETLRLLPALYPKKDGRFLSRKRLKIDKALRIVGRSLSEI